MIYRGQGKVNVLKGGGSNWIKTSRLALTTWTDSRFRESPGKHSGRSVTRAGIGPGAGEKKGGGGPCRQVPKPLSKVCARGVALSGSDGA